MKIKSVVFDIGNVLFKWNSHLAIQRAFPDYSSSYHQRVYRIAYPIIDNLSIGVIDENIAIKQISSVLGGHEVDVRSLMHHFKSHQQPIQEMHHLVAQLKRAGYELYSITDNVSTWIDWHLEDKNNVLHHLTDIVVSDQVGALKPDPIIFRELFRGRDLHPSEVVFIDDHTPNVYGARNFGMHGIEFQNPSQCTHELRALGVVWTESDN
jgi:putative hydrolase of the HAD superfamily